MATYYGTYGQKVQYLSSDPSDPQVGQVWYNSTSATLKVRSFGTASWASGGNMSTARDVLGGAGGTTSAALAIGGYPPAGGGIGTNAVESYDGTSWSGAPNLATAQYGGSTAGTQASAISIGGSNGPLQNVTQVYNGSSWTNSTNYPTAMGNSGTGGTSTAAINAGGYDGSNWILTTRTWNGSAWSTGGNLPPGAGTQFAGMAGNDTAALYFGGSIPDSAVSASYNGSSWTATPSLNTNRYTYGSGIQTLALAPGGWRGSSYTLVAEVWNGSSWTNSATNPVTHGYQVNSNRASNTPGASGLIFGGGAYPAPGNIVSTELFTGAAATTKTVTVS